MSEPTLYDVAASVRHRDPAWALGPGEAYPPAPPLWVCDDPECDCGDVISCSWAPSPGDPPGTFPAGWRIVWPPAPQARA